MVSIEIQLIVVVVLLQHLLLLLRIIYRGRVIVIYMRCLLVR